MLYFYYLVIISGANELRTKLFLNNYNMNNYCVFGFQSEFQLYTIYVFNTFLFIMKILSISY